MRKLLSILAFSLFSLAALAQGFNTQDVRELLKLVEQVPRHYLYTNRLQTFAQFRELLAKTLEEVNTSSIEEVELVKRVHAFSDFLGGVGSGFDPAFIISIPFDSAEALELLQFLYPENNITSVSMRGDNVEISFSNQEELLIISKKDLSARIGTIWERHQARFQDYVAQRNSRSLSKSYITFDPHLDAIEFKNVMRNILVDPRFPRRLIHPTSIMDLGSGKVRITIEGRSLQSLNPQYIWLHRFELIQSLFDYYTDHSHPDFEKYTEVEWAKKWQEQLSFHCSTYMENIYQKISAYVEGKYSGVLWHPISHVWMNSTQKNKLKLQLLIAIFKNNEAFEILLGTEHLSELMKIEMKKYLDTAEEILKAKSPIEIEAARARAIKEKGLKLERLPW